LLSHSATIAREMGIPSIVGIKGLLNTLEDGMRVQLNGQTGAVIILDFKSTELYMNDDVASHTPQKLKNQKHVTFPPSAVG
jgi:phosphoenolpyruvate-protein kinase (PTS system EI component)